MNAHFANPLKRKDEVCSEISVVVTLCSQSQLEVIVCCD